MSKDHKKAYRVFNCFDHLRSYISAAIACVSISAFASLVDIPIGLTSSVIALKNCVIIAGTTKYKSIINKKKKKHNNILLFARIKLNIIAVLISKALINPNISHDKCVLINNLLKEFHDIKEKIKNSNDK